MLAAHPDRPADRLALFLNALVRAVADTFPKAQPGQLLLWQRLMQLGARFTASLAAGSRPRPEAPPTPRPARPRSEPQPKPPPEDFALLFRQLPGYAKHRSQLENLLQEPRIVELLQANPQLRRVLNPLCRMLDLKPLPPPTPTPPTPGPQTPSPQTRAPAPAPHSANTPARGQSRAERRLTPGLFASPARAQPVPRSCGPPPPPSLWSVILRELDRRKIRAAKTRPARTTQNKGHGAMPQHGAAEPLAENP